MKYKLYFCIYLIVIIGLRFLEVMGLIWSDIDRDELLLYVNKIYKVFGSDKGF